ILRIELLGRRHLPKHRAELRFQLEHAAREEALDRLPGLGQHTAVGRELRAFEREHEIVGRLGRPFAKAILLIRPVNGGVDHDGGYLAAGVFELAPAAAPWDRIRRATARTPSRRCRPGSCARFSSAPGGSPGRFPITIRTAWIMARMPRN